MFARPSPNYSFDCSLEFIPQCELHDSCGHCTLELTEHRSAGQAQIGVEEVDVVKSVERLSTKLDTMPFPRKSERFRYR